MSSHDFNWVDVRSGTLDLVQAIVVQMSSLAHIVLAIHVIVLSELCSAKLLGFLQ